MFATLKSIGAYVPKKVLTNSDLEKIVDTSNDWIIKRTGIKTRYIAENELTSDLGKKAGQIAINRSGLKNQDIDMIICATISPDYLAMPSTACIIADKLGLKNIPAFDISAACSGFIYAISTAKAFIESNMYKNILIIGAEKLSSLINYQDRTTCILFGDGAGASVISRTDDKSKAIIDINISSDGEYQELLMTPLETKFMEMKGNETFKIAVKTLTKDVKDILEKNNIDKSQIKHFIPHQANYRIIKAVGDALKLTSEQIILTVSKYGNTSSASIPMAMNEIYENGSLKNGDLILLDAFGGGLTWGSALLNFNGIDLH